MVRAWFWPSRAIARSSRRVMPCCLNWPARSRTKEMPYATLMYVWSGEARAWLGDRESPHGPHPQIGGRIRLSDWVRWLDYRRDIRADFEEDFGEAPGALIGVGIMTDTDNPRAPRRRLGTAIQLVPTAGR